MTIYFVLSFKDPSPVEHPERLYRVWKLMLAVGVCSAVMILCLVVNMPWINKAFSPTAPVSGAYLQGK